MYLTFSKNSSLISYYPIEIFILPQFALLICNFIYFMCGKTFDAVHYLTQ